MGRIWESMVSLEGWSLEAERMWTALGVGGANPPVIPIVLMFS